MDMSENASTFGEENQTNKISISRLGVCEVCGSNQAIYTCPKCEVKTCCLSCVRIHKNELQCDGSRDRTKFIMMKNFTDTDLLSDYRLLEECARFVYSVKRNVNKKYTRIDKELPLHLFKLKKAALKRGTVLLFLAQNFTRHASNTTRYHFKENIIYWRVEWVFPNADSGPVKFVDERCSEKMKISLFLQKYLSPEGVAFEGSKSLLFYKSAGFNGIKVLLRAEKVKGSARKFFELDPSETLEENLSGKCIVEFPIIFVVLKDHAFSLDIISPEDEFNYNKNTNNSNLKNEDENSNGEIRESNDTRKNYSNKRMNGSKIRYNNRELLTEKIAKEKKLELDKEIKEERKRRPKNLLFTTGYSSEENMSDDKSDDDAKHDDC